MSDINGDRVINGRKFLCIFMNNTSMNENLLVMLKKIFISTLLICLLGLSGGPAMADVKPLDRVIAIVDDGVVLQSELDDRVGMFKQRFLAQGTPLPPENVMREKLLDQLVVEQIQLQMAEKMGIRVSDSQLNQTMESIAQQNGLSLDEFQQQLAQDGVTYQGARAQVKREMLIGRLQQRRVNPRVRITEKEVEDFLKSATGKANSQEEYRISHILLSNDSGRDNVELAKEIIEKLHSGGSFAEMAATYSSSSTALEGGDLGWRKRDELPTLFTEVVPKLQPGQVSEPLETSGGVHLVKLTDKRGGSSKLVTQAKVRHILIMPNEVRDDAAAKSMIDSLYDRANSGEEFAKLARENSDDAVSASAGGSLEWVSPGEMVPEFERVMGQTQVGQISKPFRSGYGWHILTVEDRRTADIGDRVQANQARQTLHRRRYEEELQSWLGEIRDEAFVELKI
ncbi:peptidylprolyl isomerase [Hahella ganghwensis]|uniref:peptidylprolyl isomerase n=1 Tax=Hahella ganghwensis TaxID=286420 RepID=UPI000368F011|nr:peptidylprolyl isomerase [Hahella ganghwensis]